MRIGATRMEYLVGNLRTQGKGQTANFDEAMLAARLRYDRYPLTRYSSASRTYEVSPSPFPVLLNMFDDKAEIADVRESMIEKAAKAWKELISATRLSPGGQKLVATASPFSAAPSSPGQQEHTEPDKPAATAEACRLFPDRVASQDSSLSADGCDDALYFAPAKSN